MRPILDTFPFPWERPVARDLHMALVQMYPQENAALFVAKGVGIQSFALALGQPVFFLWVEIINAAASAAALRQLVQLAVDQNKRHVNAPLLTALLADTPPVVETPLRGGDGKPAFLSGDDSITEPETLLFEDDLTILVGAVPGLIDTLKRMLERAPAVCKLRITQGLVSAAGTGFRIGEDLLLTNHHVLFPYGNKAVTVTAEFGYDTDADGVELAPTPIPCDVSTIVADADDDWAVLRVSAPLSPAWPILALAGAPEPVDGGRAFILQHPQGARKRLGFVRNTIVGHDDRLVLYLTDTQQGSSGSPVLDHEGRVIALHHAGGTPQQVGSKQTLVKNEGIRISRIHRALVAKGILPA